MAREDGLIETSTAIGDPGPLTASFQTSAAPGLAALMSRAPGSPAFEPGVAEVIEGKNILFAGAAMVMLGWLTGSWVLGILGGVVMANGYARWQRNIAVAQPIKTGPQMVVDLSTGTVVIAPGPCPEGYEQTMGKGQFKCVGKL